MRMNPPAGDVTLDPGRGMAWVDEHGAHLVDYASCHLEPAPMLAAVIAALESCAARELPGNVSDRAWLLSALRRECATGPGRGFLPGPGSGGPDPRAVRRAWSLADPLGAEALRLLYRHELPLRDLVYVLALPVKEAGRLIARTQDVVEILVSGLDGLARGRPICPELGPLAAAVFPDEHGEAADFGAARTALLRHIVTCVVCKRPINIRYTVPQILSRPPVADLTTETRQRLLDALNRAATARAQRPAHRPPSSFGMPLAAPVNTAPAPAARQESPSASVPPPRTVAPVTPTPPVPPLVPPDSGLSTAVPRPAPPPQPGTARPADAPSGASSGAPAGPELPERPVRAISQEDTQPGLAWPSRGSKSRAAQRPAPSPGSSGAAGPAGFTRSPQSQGPATSAASPGPAGRAGPAGSPGSPEAATTGTPRTTGTGTGTGPGPGTGTAGEPHPALGPAAELPPGQDTPLYNALLSQIRAREALARAAEAVPAPADRAPADRAGAGNVADAPGEVEFPDRPLAGAQIRIVEVLARVGSLLRATALRIVIVVVAGAAGTVTGINLFAPAPQSQRGALEANIARSSADPAGAGTGTAANPSTAGAADGAAAAGGAGAGTASGTPQTTVTATAATGDAAQSGGQSTAGSAGQPGGQSTAGSTGQPGGQSTAGSAAQPGGDGGTAGAGQPGGQNAAQDTPASPGVFLMGAWGVQTPSVITLDAFGRGTLTLSTTSGKPVKWRISAPGLVVEPSSGTLKPGHTDVLTVRALRVRYWCGVPSPVTAPLELHGPKGRKGTATVRWSTC
ncbi:hypothetical protein AAH991_09185 [Microbispora sp. ZYX-F-249]|uniref:Uncharacterized protein n=1 Tax=Microbispora maris TaxID=3144104 RepID=A0ABV0AIW9_9ACTN